MKPLFVFVHLKITARKCSAFKLIKCCSVSVISVIYVNMDQLTLTFSPGIYRIFLALLVQFNGPLKRLVFCRLIAIDIIKN